MKSLVLAKRGSKWALGAAAKTLGVVGSYLARNPKAVSTVSRGAMRLYRGKRVVPYRKPRRKYSRYNRKKRSYRRKKKITSKKSLVKTIKDVAEHTKPLGHIKEIFYDYVLGGSNSQNAVMVPQTIVTDGTKTGTWWSVAQLVDAASILFNGKVPGSGPTVTKLTTDANNFSITNLQVHIKSASVTYNIKNNTQRRYTVKAYICRPKSTFYLNGYTPYEFWNLNLSKLNCTVIGDGTGVNANNVGPTMLYNTPGELDGFNKQYAYTVKEFKLDPGSERSFVVQGPKEQTFKFESFLQGSTISNIQPCTRQVMFVVYEDLISATTATPSVPVPGRMTTSTAPDRNALVVECVSDMKLYCPELAKEGYDHESFFFKNYCPTTFDGTKVATFLEPNPAATITSPVG